MADHRAEQIIAAVKTAMDALKPTHADTVNRGRDVSLASSTDKAIDVYLGENQKNRDAFPLVYYDLTVHVDLHVKDYTAQADSLLNELYKQVAIALWADYTLGLSFVSDLNEDGADAPEIEGGSEETTATMRTTWTFTYSRNQTDPSA